MNTRGRGLRRPAPRPTPAIAQDGRYPYRMRCRGCGEKWIPKPKADGSISEYLLDKSAAEHWKTCRVWQQ